MCTNANNMQSTMFSTYTVCMTPHADNEIDGDAFLELSEDDIRTLVPKLGMVKKICRLQKQLVSQFVCYLKL